MYLIDKGPQIDESDEQSQNAASPRNESLERASNATPERDLHPEKQDGESAPTDEGMQIDESDGQDPNAESLMEQSSEPDSTVIV
jgi:hypothetical protein